MFKESSYKARLMLSHVMPLRALSRCIIANRQTPAEEQRNTCEVFHRISEKDPMGSKPLDD
jgi:hypothetical protein